MTEVGSVEVFRYPQVRALEDLISEALRRALDVPQRAARLVVHSDQGSQYPATRFKDLLTRPEMDLVSW